MCHNEEEKREIECEARDDDNWRKHTLSWVNGKSVRLDYRAVGLVPLTKTEDGGIDLKKIAPKARVY